MVEYALLTAGTALQTMYVHVASFASGLPSGIDWPMLGAGLLLLLTLRFIFASKA